MDSLVLAAILFVGTHLLLPRKQPRSLVTGAIGEKGFQAVYSLISVVTLVWMCWAWSQIESSRLWGPLDDLQPLAWLLMLIAFLLAGIGLTTPSPTAMGRESLLEEEDPVKGILRITRHPFMWSVALFSLTHIIFLGSLDSLVFFGALLFLALVGTMTIDAKRAASFGESWSKFAGATSNVPFGAIAQGRNSLAIGELGWWRIGVGLVLFVVLLGAHPHLFG
jgi:uncharacterized membrane protein